MVNVSEPLINAVSHNKPKVLTGLAKRQGCKDTESSLSVRKQSHPGEQAEPKPFTKDFQTELGKSVFSPQGKATRKGSRWGCG